MDCLQSQFVTDISGLKTPENFCLQAGEQISEDIDPMVGTDLCCEGLGWVRIGNTYPSSNFPTPDPVTTKCLPLGWAQEFEVGLLGCYHPGGDPSMASCTEHTEQAVADAARLEVLRNVACCFDAATQQDSKTRGRLWTVQGIAISGPRGNCISRVMTILYGIGKCC